MYFYRIRQDFSTVKGTSLEQQLETAQLTVELLVIDSPTLYLDSHNIPYLTSSVIGDESISYNSSLPATRPTTDQHRQGTPVYHHKHNIIICLISNVMLESQIRCKYSAVSVTYIYNGAHSSKKTELPRDADVLHTSLK